MSRMTGAQALVDLLKLHGVDTLFALPGVQNDGLFNALYDAGGAIRVIHTRHEQGAAYMAYGYARSTGRVGAYSVVPGPGVLNTGAALSTAYAANARVLCLTGQIASSAIGRGFGMLHELPDQLSILKGLTKYAARIEHPTQAQRVVDEAFRQLNTGRPRPVAIEVPPDVLTMESEVTLHDPYLGDPEIAPDADAVRRAAELLSKAKHPLIVVGSGAEDGGAELLAVAQMLQAPVVTPTSGRGIISDRNYLSLDGPAGHRLWAEADVVLAVGTRLLRPLTMWGVDDALKIIRVDIDPNEPARVKAPAISIVADARLTLAALRDALPAQNGVRPSREAELRALKAETRAKMSAALTTQFEYLAAIRDVLPDDGILVDEVTQMGYVADMAYPTYRPRTLITSGYQGTLGYGFATALGVKVANPDKPVISISGDGGFMYNVQELSTAVAHNIALVAVVFVDGYFGNVYRMQKEQYGGRVIASKLQNPDFVKLAESFGVNSGRAASPDELHGVLRTALAHNGPTLIEVPVGQMNSPWGFAMLPRVRGLA
jgi:acetolactate synthase I/II/III large subunit